MPVAKPLGQTGDGFTNLWGLAQGAQTAAANLEFDLLSVLDDRLFMDVGLETGLGVAHGVADVIAAHPGLEANVASHVLFSSSE